MHEFTCQFLLFVEYFVCQGNLHQLALLLILYLSQVLQFLHFYIVHIIFPHDFLFTITRDITTLVHTFPLSSLCLFFSSHKRNNLVQFHYFPYGLNAEFIIICYIFLQNRVNIAKILGALFRTLLSYFKAN